MEFFKQQDKTTYRSLLFLGFFWLSVIGFTLVVYLLTMLYLSWQFKSRDFLIWHFPVSPIVIGLVLGPIVFESLVRIHQLKSQGSQAIIERMDARYIESFCECPLELRLKNVVEEMAIASNQPRPEIYALNEIRINAITVGMSKDDICLGVTQGALENLTRDELQGLVATQFAQIINGDVQFKTHMIGWLHGVSFVQRFGEALEESVFGFALNAIGYIGHLQATWIKRIFCRERQYLGDAYAVQYTRNPDSVGGALKKAKNNSCLSMLVNTEAAHLFFTEPCPVITSMHPCVEDRLDAIYEGRPGRHEDPTYPPTAQQPHHSKTVSVPEKADKRSNNSFIPSSNSLLTGLAEESPTHYSFPMDILPMEITGESAEAAIIAILDCADSKDNKLVKDFTAAYSKSEPTRQLRLIDQAVRKISKLPKDKIQDLEKRVNHLINSDGRIDLFEFMVLMILQRHLKEQSYPDTITELNGIGQLIWETQLLLSAVAISGSTEQQADVAFSKGAADLEFEIGSYVDRIPTADCHWENIEKAINQFSKASDAAKSLLVSGLREAAKADNKIEDNELYIIQGICAAIDMPMPELMSPLQAE